MLLNVSKEKNTTNVWKMLGDLYYATSLVNKRFLWKKLFTLRMGDGDFIVEHMNVFNTIINQLILSGVNMDEED